MKVFKHYSDPGHGWVAVKRELIEHFDLLEKISEFSYQKGHTVYLEEDIDAPTVLDELTRRGLKWKTETIIHDNRSSIRTYSRYVPMPECLDLYE